MHQLIMPTVAMTFLFFSSVAMFFFGFKDLRRKRLIENIPTSTVRGLAMGLVEVIGKPNADTLCLSPLSKTPCVLYSYTVEPYSPFGPKKHDKIIAKGDNFQCPFWLDDGTGRILIFPREAEIIMPFKYVFDVKLQTGVKDIPPALIEFMEKNGIKYENIMYSFKECRIDPEDTVYVLGTARKAKNLLKMHKHELTEQQKGRIDVSDVMIAKGDKKSVFIISNKSQKWLVKKIAQDSHAVFAGAILALASLFFILCVLWGFFGVIRF